MSLSVAPSKTGVTARKFSLWAASPRCVSSTCPRFMRDGTPMGFRMMSMVVPSGRYGRSSTGMMRETTPLLPWRPAILSPTWSVRVCATQTRTSLFTPGASSSPCSRVSTLTSITLPRSPCGTRSEVSFTSRAFSPKIARSSFSSAVSSVSPLGVILPTKMSPGPTSAPTRMMPSSSRFRSASSPTFGMSRVISPGPSFVSRDSPSYFSMWIDVNFASRISVSEMMIASSKL